MLFKSWLNEMAMQWGGDLALFAENDNTFLCLYKQTPMLRRILQQWDYDAFDKLVYGVIDLRDNTLYRTWEVERIWARSGYGPFMYLVAMSVAGNEGLTPNRVASQVTPAAKEVWRQFFQGEGRNYVTPIPLEGNARDHHKEEYLNYKYVIKNPVNIKQLVNSSRMTFRNDVHGELRTTFHELAEATLGREINNIYGS